MIRHDRCNGCGAEMPHGQRLSGHGVRPTQSNGLLAPRPTLVGCGPVCSSCAVRVAKERLAAAGCQGHAAYELLSIDGSCVSRGRLLL